MSSNTQDNIPPEVVELLRRARSVAVLTGAGISAESGIPTFRDPRDGLWAQYEPEQLATPGAFRRNPRLVWDWHMHLRELMQAAAPNHAHHALADMQRLLPELTLITQNIDGLHQLAGSSDVIELHGSIRQVRCSADGRLVAGWEAQSARPPRCPACQAPLRPDVVWFGELLPVEALARAKRAAKTCDLFFSIGTSGVVEPAASLAYRAMECGAPVVILNLDVQSEGSRGLYKLHGPAGTLLPALVRAAWPDEQA